MHCFSIAVLRVLDKKHHEEGDDRGRSVDHQLPGIGKMKHWSGKNPDKDDKHGSGKSPCTSESDRGMTGKDPKCIAHHAKTIALLFFFLYLFGLGFHYNRLNFARNLTSGYKHSLISA